jgi:hypothetical protein
MMRIPPHIGLLELLGYDPAVSAAMAPRDVAWLALVSLLGLAGALLFASAGAYLVYLGLNTGRLQPYVVAVTALLVFSFALNMQRMFVTSGGYGYHGDLRALNAWKPDGLRLVCVLFLALLFAQPLLLLVNRAEIESKMQAQIQAIGAVYRSTQLAEIGRQADGLLERRAWVEEKMRLLGMPAPAGGTSSGRKALVLGMQAGAEPAASAAVVKAAADMRVLLASMGFAVADVTGSGNDEALLALDRYLKQLRAGDVSVIYIVGHAGKGIKLTQLMDDVAAAMPRASVVLVDGHPAARRDDRVPLTDGWPRANPPANTLLAVAAAAGPTARAGSGFTQALLHHLGRGEDVGAVMRQVAADAGPTPFIASALKGGYIQLSGTVAAVALPPGALAGELGQTCPELGPGADEPALKRCLSSARRVLDAELAEAEGRRGPGLERKLAAYRASVQRSGMVRERWRMLWSDGWRNGALMLLCILGMTAGDLLRDLFPFALRRYEAGRAALGRTLVERRFARAREHVGGWLASYPAAPLPGARWHEVDSYFELANAAVPLATPAFESHGSPDDLLDRLAWQSQDEEAIR